MKWPMRDVAVSWCLYDFANSAFATTVLAVLFNEYFARSLAGGMDGTEFLGNRIPGPTLYTILLSLSLFLVAVFAPMVGLRSDRSGRPVVWLGLLAFSGIIATAFLGSLDAGDLPIAFIIFPIAVLGFALSSVVYNGILPRICKPSEMGRLSGWGWGLGYLGGGLILALDLVLLKGMTLPNGSYIKITVAQAFPLTALWWALFSLPLLITARKIPIQKMESQTRNVKELLVKSWRSAQLRRFLLANLLYGDGIQTVVAMASIFAATILKWPPEKLVLYFLVIQGSALFGSPILGWWADRLSDRKILQGCLIVWVLIVIATWRLGWTGHAQREYWVLGVIGGFVLGPTQSLGRSLLGRATPPQGAGSVFSLFAISNRFAAIFGPLTYGLVLWATDDLRKSVLSMAPFFIAGAVCLAGLKEKDLKEELHKLVRNEQNEQ